VSHEPQLVHVKWAAILGAQSYVRVAVAFARAIAATWSPGCAPDDQCELLEAGGRRHALSRQALHEIESAPSPMAQIFGRGILPL
jgi:hypothetical protein